MTAPTPQGAWYAINSVLTLIAAFLSAPFAYKNFTWNFAPDSDGASKFFGFEMDGVMGVMCSIPKHYSKLEGVLLSCGAIGAGLSWGTDQDVQLLSCIFIFIGASYFLLLTPYFAIMKETPGCVVGLIFGSIGIGLGLAKVFAFHLEKEKQQIAWISLLVCLCFTILAGIVMKLNSPNMTETIDTLKRMKKFDANPDNAGYAWDPNTNLPVDFNAKDSIKRTPEDD